MSDESKHREVARIAVFIRDIQHPEVLCYTSAEDAVSARDGMVKAWSDGTGFTATDDLGWQLTVRSEDIRAIRLEVPHSANRRDVPIEVAT